MFNRTIKPQVRRFTATAAASLTLLAACADPSTEVDEGDSTSADDSATDTTSADGSTADSSTSDGSTSDDSTSDGTTSDGSTSGDTTSDASTSNGSTSDATMTGETDSGSGSDSSGVVCGDGMVEGSEACDDGNEQDDDGCASDCTPELYYRCVGEGAGSCAPIRMLFALAANDEPSFREAAAEVTGGVVDYLNVMGTAVDSTPTLAELEANYDCVFTHPVIEYDDAEGLGEVLADYVDGGANVVLGVAWDHPPPTGLGGTPIGEPEYAPVSTESASTDDFSYAGDGSSPIHTGVVAYTTGLSDTGVALQGAGMQDGSFDNGTIATAYRPDFKVVYVNGTGQGDYGPMGDWALLVANACAVGYLAPG